MRRNMETRTAVAANPKEMALALVAESAPLMDEAAAAAATSAVGGSDAVPEPAAIPTHGLDICPANLLIYTCLAAAACDGALFLARAPPVSGPG
jgi:hypothetical protein